MMLDATRNYDPTAHQRNDSSAGKPRYSRQAAAECRSITTGAWRTGPMQVISGAIGHEKVHFEAPGPSQLEKQETAAFIDWFNTPSRHRSSPDAPA